MFPGATGQMRKFKLWKFRFNSSLPIGKQDCWITDKSKIVNFGTKAKIYN